MKILIVHSVAIPLKCTYVVISFNNILSISRYKYVIILELQA